MFRIDDLVSPDGFEREQYVRLLYEVILQRDPDPVGLSKFLQRQDSKTFFKEILSSPEFRGKAQNACYIPGLRMGAAERPRVLLFGAYGNGNLGDKIQAESLSRAIRHIRPDVEVWSSSALRAAYPFPFERVLPGEAFNNPRIVNQFDMLIIGGGGLLSHPHDPLTNPGWQKAIRIPVALIGVGAAANVVRQSETLLKNAVYVSVRDEHSMDSMKKVMKDAKFLSDPVLCDAHYDVRAQARPLRRPRGQRKLWILKYLQDNQWPMWRELIDPENDEVCFLEPPLDFPLVSEFPFARPIYRVEELIALIDSVDMVVSMRYHGCILAMLRDRPVIGVREHKSLDLFRRYGNEPYFVRNLPPGSIDPSGYKSPADMLVHDRAKFISEMGGLLAALKGAGAASSERTKRQAPVAPVDFTIANSPQQRGDADNVAIEGKDLLDPGVSPT